MLNKKQSKVMLKCASMQSKNLLFLSYCFGKRSFDSERSEEVFRSTMCVFLLFLSSHFFDNHFWKSKRTSELIFKNAFDG